MIANHGELDHEKSLQEAGIRVVQEGLALAWRPNASEYAQAVAFGRAFGEKVKASLGED